MDYASCNVVLVDRAAGEDRVVRRTEDKWANSWSNAPAAVAASDGHEPTDENIHTLLGIFSEVHVCTTAKSCLSKLSEFNTSSKLDLTPTLVLLDIPCDDPALEEAHSRSPSPSSKHANPEQVRESSPESLYGLELLQWVSAEIQYQGLSKLIVPIAMLSRPAGAPTDQGSEHPELLLDSRRVISYLDAGAVDVLPSPLRRGRLPSIAIHAYRAHREASKDQKALLEMKWGRKRSWVGVDDQKPYAYLREAMVSNLMDGICKGQVVNGPGHMGVFVAPDRREAVAAAVGSWQFSAHDFTDDELLHCARVMLEHALTLPALEPFRISTEMITGFLVSCRSAYNAFVPYHNFRHVIDVLQATFHFLLRIGSLPPMPGSTPLQSSSRPRSPIASLIGPFEALTLLITAIGHDVGHPGVNNAFLVVLNAPLAQLYNDKSVLEAFHCAAYSQILRRHWPAAFRSVQMRQLMINSILATDMGLHFDYMQKLGNLQDKLHNDSDVEGWTGRFLEDQRTLACALLIKCADISNVARRYDCAVKWTMILTEEFSRQASMEIDLEIPSTLFAPPTREMVALSKSQIGFINLFALPLFQGVADIMHEMQFSVDEINTNKKTWEDRMAYEQAKVLGSNLTDAHDHDGVRSPRSMSVATTLPIKSKHDHHTVTHAIAQLERAESLDGNDGHDTSTTGSDARSNSSGAFPNESLASSASTMTRDSSKPIPSQLQLNHSASTSASGDHTTLKGSSNGAVDSSPVDVSSPYHQTRQRGSNTTDGSGSVSGPYSNGDWTSQATSATTSKLPLSPSTDGTSITSRNSIDRLPLGQSLSRGKSSPELSFLAHDPNDVMTTDKNGTVTIMQTVRSLSRKPSRFRLSFWKKKHERMALGAEETAS